MVLIRSVVLWAVIATMSSNAWAMCEDFGVKIADITHRVAAATVIEDCKQAAAQTKEIAQEFAASIETYRAKSDCLSDAEYDAVKQRVIIMMTLAESLAKNCIRP